MSFPPHRCAGVTRRSFLADTGMGLTGMVLGSMLFRDGQARGADSPWRPPDGLPHFAPKAKSVIWIFLCGGVSHLESFDIKPALNEYAGKSIEKCWRRREKTSSTQIPAMETAS